MPTVVPLALRQSNDEIIDLIITPTDPADSLLLVTKLVVIIKPDACTSDADTSVITLTTANPAQVTITSQLATEIQATVYIPAMSLAAPYDRFWRCDAYVNTAKRTALYGPVDMIDL
jgi:hypothetical protein